MACRVAIYCRVSTDRQNTDNQEAVRRKFDVVAAWSVDRLGRSLQDLVGFLSQLHRVGVDLYLHQQAIDTTTAAGKALFQMMGVFAEFERSMIRDRVNAGLARAKAQGNQLGRRKIAAKVERAWERSSGSKGRYWRHASHAYRGTSAPWQAV